MLEAACRPHMAMLVGNAVVGDSRVEKAADSAVAAGYDVTVVGIRSRTTTPMGRHGDVPVQRMLLDTVHHRARETWEASRPRRHPDWSGLLDDAEAASAADPQRRLPARLADGAQRRISAAAAKLELRRPGGWRTVWPQILDYEEAFVRALIGLDPDVVHVHDRHPMSAAVAYRELMRSRGKDVPWVYDAHEWLPGQTYYGPPEHRLAWLAAEKELAPQADAVISVNETLAERMRERHSLAELPISVPNAPRITRAPLDPSVRLPLREECGLDETTPLLVYVGRMTEKRGLFTIVDGLAQLDGVHAAFLGNDDQEIRALIAERAEAAGVADRIHLLTYVPAESVTWYISSATIGLSPLLGTPAHRLAIPTKIYESLHAGLPLVVSDLPLQAAFVRDSGLGTVHAVGDVDDFARAVRRVLDDLESYRAAAADPETQRRFSWAAAEDDLASLWHRLTPASSAVRSEPRASAQTGDALALIGLGDADGLAGGWADGEDAIVLPDSAPHRSGRLAREWTRAWSAVDRCASTVLYSPAALAFGGIDGDQDEEISSLKERGKRCGVLFADRPLLRARALIDAFPEHPFREWPAEAMAKYDRQLRRSGERALRLRGHGVPLLSSSPLTARLVDGVRYLPLVASASAPARTARAGARTIVVAPGVRSQAEERALDAAVARAEAAGHTVVRPARARHFTLDSVREADLVIEAIGLPEYGRAAASGLASGAAVIGSAPLQQDSPVITATAESLEEVVADLLSADDAEWRERSERGASYAAEVHSPQAVAARIRELL